MAQGSTICGSICRSHVNRLESAGLDVERELPKLATYLGHVHVNETYWYLEAVPELLQLATDRVMNNRKRARPYV